MTYTPNWKNDFNFECEYIPSWYNDFNFPDLGCDNILGDFDVYVGSVSTLDITIGEEWSAVHGQHLSVELTQTQIPWDFLCYDGAQVNSRIAPSANFGTTMGSGESLSAGLTTFGFVFMAANSWYGENLDTTLTRDRILSFDLLAGEEFNSDIRYSIADGMKGNIGHGESVTVDINFNSMTFRSNIGHGESVTVDKFTTILPVPLSLKPIEHGDELKGALSNSYRFVTNQYHDIGSCVAELINTEEGLWRARSGELASLTLSADYGVLTRTYCGEQINVALQTKEPVRLSADIIDGHSWHVSLHHLYSAPLYPYPMVNDSWFDVAIDPAWLHLSTCRSCKLPIVNDQLIIRLERFEDIRTTWSAEIGTATSFSLTRDIRPDVIVESGEMMVFSMDTIIEITPDKMIDGSTIYPLYLTTAEKTITDRTNPILDGDDVITDNGSPEPIPEEFLSTRAGEQCFASLAIPRHPETEFSSGEVIKWDLTEDKPWEIIIGHGERLNFVLSTTVRLDFNAADGSFNEQSLYNPPINIYQGEHMKFQMKLTYDVEWQETGCLDNEWTYENKAENTTVAVEQTPFRHSLKARCY